MNTRNQTRWTVALAAVALTLTAACGAETAVAPSDIGGAEGDAPAAETWADDNPARLDFGDDFVG